MQKDIVNSLVVVSPKHQQTARIERQTPDERTASAHVRVASDVSAAWSRGAVDILLDNGILKCSIFLVGVEAKHSFESERLRDRRRGGRGLCLRPDTSEKSNYLQITYVHAYM